jgi:hypothetical protein
VIVFFALGFLTPLVGINVFLASYRFKKPVVVRQIGRADTLNAPPS